MMEKEFLYVGHYVDAQGFYILKVGTTKDLKRRAQEHTRNYHRAKEHTMPPEQAFEYDWYHPLSKYNTHRFEDKTIDAWKAQAIGEYVRNDRFKCQNKPEFVEITIRKTYKIAL